MEKVKINIVPKGLKPACYVSQNDNGRVVRFELFDELTPYTLDGSETITITVVRPDGVELVSSVVNTEDSYIDVVFNDDMTAIAGIADCELTITDGETVLGSRNFDMNIEIDAYNGKDVVIETATGVIASFNTEVEDNALEYESEIPYNAEGYTGLKVINSSTTPVFNKTPYLYRKTPSGNSCIEELNGLSVAINQLVDTSNINQTATYCNVLVTNNNDGTITLNGTADENGWAYISGAFSVIANHIYLLGGSDSLALSDGYITDRATRIVKNTHGNNMSLYAYLQNGVTYNTTIGVFCIDLTALFGSSTIPNYLYNLETQTAGSGYQKLKELGFDASYFPYNIGSLMSSKPVAKRVIGKNLLKLENREIIDSGAWENTTPRAFNGNRVFLGLTMDNYFNPSFITSYTIEKNKITMETTGGGYGIAFDIKVKPNTAYCFAYLNQDINLIGYGFYDSNGYFISWTQGATITTPNNCYYMTIVFRPLVNTFTTYNNPQLEYGSTISAYEPYKSSLYNLGGDTLRGLFKLDSNNNIYAYGDIKTSDGKIKRRFDIVDLGSLNWIIGNRNTDNDAYTFYYNLTEIKNYSGAIADNFIFNPNISTWESLKKGEFSVSDTYLIFAADYNSAYDFKTAMDGHYLIYEVETPTTESSTPFDNPQEVKITEEFIDGRSVEIPVGHDTIYGTDIEYLDIDFDTTIFGGDINAIDGVLTSRYNSDGSVKTTPDVIELDPALIPVKAGDNNIFNSASGAQTIRYYNQED